jgi:WD40 repeat protein
VDQEGRGKDSFKSLMHSLCFSHPSATEIRTTLDTDDSVQGFFDHTDSVYTIALSPVHPTLALTGDGNNQAYLWDITTGEKRFHLSGHSDSVIDGGFSPDGKLVATASMDATVRVYRVSDGALKHTLEGPAKELIWMKWHPVGPVLAVGSADETVWMWNAESGACMSVFSGHSGAVTAGAWTADGKTLITTGESGDLIVWNPKSGEADVHNKSAHEGPVTSVTTHPDKSSKLVATGGADGIVKIFSYDSGKMLAQLRTHADSVEDVQFAPKSVSTFGAGCDRGIELIHPFRHAISNGLNSNAATL